MTTQYYIVLGIGLVLGGVIGFFIGVWHEAGFDPLGDIYKTTKD